jgi:hypothetical protein
MPLEVTCGHCQGDILVEAAGVTVECPLCGAHVEIPDPEAAIEVPASAAAPQPQDATVILPSDPSDLSEQPTVISHAANGGDDWRPQSIDEESSPSATFVEPTDAPDFSITTPTEVVTPAAVPERFSGASLAASIEHHVHAAQASVPWNWFVIVASYASAATIILVYLFLTRQQHALESLPDLVPKVRGDSVALVVPAPQENVAPGHVLRLGKSQRYGSVRVTPVKITRGPIEFDHAYKDQGVQLNPSEPVYKLWLKFENVSRDQVFPPLDRTLVFKRVFLKQNNQRPLTNNFLCAVDQRHKEGNLHYVYDMPELSEFVVVGQNLDQDVKPGETWETFIPSEELIDDLTGDCVWRVQFRKGYNPSSGRGVTTLIDVQFHADEIVDEPFSRDPEGSVLSPLAPALPSGSPLNEHPIESVDS